MFHFLITFKEMKETRGRKQCDERVVGVPVSQSHSVHALTPAMSAVEDEADHNEKLPLIDNNNDNDDADDDGETVSNRRRALASRVDSLSARSSPASASHSPYAAHVESMATGKVSIEREGDPASLVHFATGQAVIEQQLDDSGVRDAFFTDRHIALIEQSNEHELLLDADRAIAVALLGRNRVRRGGKHHRLDDRDELELVDAIGDEDNGEQAEMVPLQSAAAAPAPPSTTISAAPAISAAAPLTKLDAMQLLKTMQACDLITPQCRQFYTRKLVNTTVVGEADGALALMAAFGDNLAELATELHTYADLPPPNVQIITTEADDPDVPRRRRSSASHRDRAAKERSRPPSGPPTALTPALVKKPSKPANVGSGRLRVRFAETTDDNDRVVSASAAATTTAAAAAATVADDDDESGDPLDKAPRSNDDAGKKKSSDSKRSRGKKHHRSSSSRNAANFAPVSAAARANAKMFRMGDKPQTNAAFDERLTKIMNGD
jgi:hypothetical protein